MESPSKRQALSPLHASSTPDRYTTIGDTYDSAGAAARDTIWLLGSFILTLSADRKEMMLRSLCLYNTAGADRQNRMSTMTDESNVENDSASAHGDRACLRTPFDVQWKPGVEPPPFTTDNSDAVQFVLGLTTNTSLVPPKIRLSKAVAIQIYLLFQVEQLKHLAFKFVYRAMAALALGEQPAVVLPAAVERLRNFMYLKDNRSRSYVGLIADYKYRIQKRKDREMTPSEARLQLLKQLDLEPLNFCFKEAARVRVSGGGGDGDPSGSADAVVQSSDPPAAAPTGRLDIRTRTFEVQLELMAINIQLSFSI